MQINIQATFSLSREFDVPDDIGKEDLLAAIRAKCAELGEAFSYSLTLKERSGLEWTGTEVTSGDDVPILTINAPYEDEVVHDDGLAELFKSGKEEEN